jgi:hypothetical protein
MSERRDIAETLMREVMAARVDHPAEILSALVSCLIVTINDLADESSRARVVITTLQAIVSNVDAPSAVLAAAAKEIALADVVGSA